MDTYFIGCHKVFIDHLAHPQHGGPYYVPELLFTLHTRRTSYWSMVHGCHCGGTVPSLHPQ